MPTTESDLHEPDLPIELGEVVTARLGGTAAAARILTGWTKKVTEAGMLFAVGVCMCLACLDLGEGAAACCQTSSGPSVTAMLHGRV